MVIDHHHHHHIHHPHQAKSKGRRSAPIDRTEAAFNIFDSDKEPDHPDHNEDDDQLIVIVTIKNVSFLQDGYVTKQEFLRNTSKLTDEQVTLLID